MTNRLLEMANRHRYGPSIALPASPMLRVLRSDEEDWATALKEDLARLPRRFQPRLAAGFDDAPGDGLRDFDRAVPREFVEMRRCVTAVLAGIALATVIFLTLGGGETTSLETGCSVQRVSADGGSDPASLSPMTMAGESCPPGSAGPIP